MELVNNTKILGASPSNVCVYDSQSVSFQSVDATAFSGTMAKSILYNQQPGRIRPAATTFVYPPNDFRHMNHAHTHTLIHSHTTATFLRQLDHVKCRLVSLID